MEPTVEVETITPEIAAKYLEKNEGNRREKRFQQQILKTALEQGRMLFTGDSIKFDRTGRLIDGQNRLISCIDAGKAFRTVVVRDLDPEVFAVLDQNAKRTIGDTLGIVGIDGSTTVGAAARLVLGYRTGCIGDASHSASWQKVAHPQAIIEEVQNNIDVYGRGRMDMNKSRKSGMNPSSVTAFRVILEEEIGREDASSFISPLVTGVGLDDGDPRIAARNWSARNRGANVIHLSVYIRAYNALTKNESRSMIKAWLRGSPYPRITSPS